MALTSILLRDRPAMRAWMVSIVLAAGLTLAMTSALSSVDPFYAGQDSDLFGVSPVARFDVFLAATLAATLGGGAILLARTGRYWWAVFPALVGAAPLLDWFRFGVRPSSSLLAPWHSAGFYWFDFDLGEMARWTWLGLLVELLIIGGPAFIVGWRRRRLRRAVTPWWGAATAFAVIAAVASVVGPILASDGRVDSLAYGYLAAVFVLAWAAWSGRSRWLPATVLVWLALSIGDASASISVLGLLGGLPGIGSRYVSRETI